MLHQYADIQRCIDLLNKTEQLDAEAEPFYIMVMVIAAIFVVAFLAEEYASKQDHAEMSSMVAQCANGKAVQFGDSVMRCKVSEMVVQR